MPNGKVSTECDSPVIEAETSRQAFEPEMVAIPAGSFEMGLPSNEQGRSGDEGPVHTVHVEAFNASQQRKHSAYRCKTNIYTKNKDVLQRVLNCKWIVHNFINKHATIKQIMAVSLGILE